MNINSLLTTMYNGVVTLDLRVYDLAISALCILYFITCVMLSYQGKNDMESIVLETCPVLFNAL